MYTAITTKENLIEALEKYIHRSVGVYYICEYCDDEQMYIQYVTEETIKQVEGTGSIFVDFACNNETCGRYTKFIKHNYVTGIEE